MLVRFKQNWFAPSEPHHPDRTRVFSGQRFRKGDHEVPRELKPFLPRSAEVLVDDDEPVPTAEYLNPLYEADATRAQEDNRSTVINKTYWEQEELKKAEDEKKRKLHEKLTKAREAKRLKKLAKEEKQGNGESDNDGTR